MDERTAAQAFEQQLGTIPLGLLAPVQNDHRDLQDSIHVAKELRALTAEWQRLVSPALKREVASIANRAHAGDEHRRSIGHLGRTRALRFGVTLTTAATVIIMAVPAARQGVTRQFYRVLDVVAVGPATEVVRDDARTPEEVSSLLRETDRQLARGGMWHLSTPYGGFGGGVPPGVSPSSRRVDRLELLGPMTPMTVQLPTCAYRGAVPVFNHALVAPTGLVLLFLGSGEGEVLVVQAPVGSWRGEMSYSRSVTGTDKQGRLVVHSPELKTEDLLLNGQSVTWDPDTTGIMPNSSALRWERDGISYSLMGRRLTKDEAVQLFLSLRPARTAGPQ